MDITAEHFNKWMDDYIENPEKFARDWQTVGKHVEERMEGVEPTYGDLCLAYLEQVVLD